MTGLARVYRKLHRQKKNFDYFPSTESNFAVPKWSAMQNQTELKRDAFQNGNEYPEWVNRLREKQEKLIKLRNIKWKSQKNQWNLSNTEWLFWVIQIIVLAWANRFIWSNLCEHLPFFVVKGPAADATDATQP